ncbi:hypothetical protein B7R21_17520 [Subtercola boreus]|uniref:HTH lacI-type domain-containing protein n=1 Tax=Subtercola boreus TaxID=120213 RepID=A0A3E0VBN6_9MICO|nr:LacI family DNA-binding transcriptional regulator [Subtercola boreus]RFA06918.1 hypothetical protein B7R21_17520 [Subtercola boreus]
MQEPVTLQDIADRVGVARGTVSSALSGKGRISAETRDRIRATAEELGYVANTVARNLRVSRSGSIGLHVPDDPLSYPFYMAVVYGVVTRAQEEGILVTVVPKSISNDTRFEDHLDGFIVIDPHDGDEMAARLLRGRRPVVSGEAPPADVPAPAAIVTSDNHAGATELVRHLVDRGARSVLGVIAPPVAAWSREVAAGFHLAVEDSGIRSTTIILGPDVGPEQISEQIAAAVTDDVDAVLCAAEGTALIALQTLTKMGRRVGVDILLASWPDSLALSATIPSVSSIDLRARAIGAACVEALIEAIEEAANTSANAPTSTRTIHVPYELVLRDSTRRLTGR